MRGIVISPEYKILEDGYLKIGPGLDSEKLRQYVLYWDKIDFPNNNLFSFSGTPEVDFLIQEGIMQRTQYRFDNVVPTLETIVDIYTNMQHITFIENNKREKAAWSMAQPNRELILNKDLGLNTRVLEVNLYNSLPIPSAENSLEDILKFKDRRRDELEHFRFLMDGFYQNLLKSGDSERAMLSYLEEIERQINAIKKTMNESFLKTLWKSLKARYDVSEMMKNGAIGTIGAMSLDLPVLTSGLLGAVSAIKVNTEISLKPKDIPDNSKAYAYLYYADKELN